MPLRIIFCGTPVFAVPTLLHLAAQPDFQVASVVAQPDRPRGRGQQTSSPPVKDAALEAGIAVYQPEKIRAASTLDYFRKLAPDVVVIVAYGRIIPPALLEVPRLGWINLHASLLPKYRGAAPVHWAIANGETRSGLTTMRIDAGLDTGPMLLKREIDIGPDETALELTARLAEAGAPLMAETLRRLERRDISSQTQDDSEATLAPPLKKEDGRIDWNSRAPEIYNRIRAFQPWPGTFTTFRGKQCHLWGQPVALAHNKGPGAIVTQGRDIIAACGDGTSLRLAFVQLAGRKRVSAQEFSSGARLSPGDAFGRE